MAVKELNEIYSEVGRNLDNQLDENTLVAGETGTKTFGAFKFFSGIKRFLENSAKKVVKGGASVEGGLAVDSLTVSGSALFPSVTKTPALNTTSCDYLELTNGGVFWIGNYFTKIGNLGVLNLHVSCGANLNVKLGTLRQGYRPRLTNYCIFNIAGTERSYKLVIDDNGDVYAENLQNFPEGYSTAHLVYELA